MKALLIAEKPSLMRDIQQVYNRMHFADDVDFSAFVGHVVALKEPDEYKEEWGKPWRVEVLPMIPEPFEYKPSKSAYDVFKQVRDKIKTGKYDYLINACDAGREGELIFQAFYDAIGCKLPVKRLWASDTTEDTLKEALNNLIPDTEPSLQRLKASSKYRAYFDWLLGMNLSRAITLKSKQNVPIGRVMTPTLAIIVNRELEITNFKPTNYYQLEADFGDYKGTWFNPATGDNKIMDLKKAEDIKNRIGKDATVADVAKERKKNYAPTLHSLLELQKEANKAYGYSAQQTLDIAQALYEKHKLISYPRTESRYLPKNLADKLPKHLQALTAVPTLKAEAEAVLADKSRMEAVMKSKKYVDDKKVTDHHAIIVTQTIPALTALKEEERNVYLLVAKRMLAIFLDPYVVDKTTVITNVGEDQFKSSGSVVIDLGYMRLYKTKTEDSELPALKKGDARTVQNLKLLTKETTPPSRYDDSSLLQAMANAGGFVDDEELQSILKETAGLGTSATRAGIIEKLISRKMITKKGKSFYATKFGIDIIESLRGRDIISPELTAKWEMKLTQVEEGKLDMYAFRDEMIAYTQEVTKDFMTNVDAKIESQKTSDKEPMGKCPVCSSDVLEGKGAYYCKNAKFLGGSCELSIPKVFGEAKITKTEAKKLLAGKETKELSFKWKSGKTGKGKLVLDAQGKMTFANANSSASAQSATTASFGNCPCCDKPLKSTANYVLCEGYKETCQFIIARTISGAKLSNEDIEALLKGETTQEKTFTWKSGKTGKARLKLENNKVEFVFN